MKGWDGGGGWLGRRRDLTPRKGTRLIINARLLPASAERPPGHVARIESPTMLAAPRAMAPVFWPPVALVCSHKFCSAAGSSGDDRLAPPDLCRPVRSQTPSILFHLLS